MRRSQVTIYSCYWTARKEHSLAAFRVLLNDLEAFIRNVGKHSEVIIAGHFNAKSYFWDPNHDSEKGHLLAELASSLGLNVGNVGVSPTFVRLMR